MRRNWRIEEKRIIIFKHKPKPKEKNKQRYVTTNPATMTLSSLLQVGEKGLLEGKLKLATELDVDGRRTKPDAVTSLLKTVVNL